MLASENIGQAFRRMGYFRSLSTQMKAEATRIREMQDELEHQKSRLQNMKQEAEQVKKTRVKELEDLRKDEKETDSVVKKLKKDKNKMTVLRNCCHNGSEKRIAIREKGFAMYPSDQKNFPYGVGICALRRNKLCLYLGRIHTKRDTILEEANVELLTSTLLDMVKE